MFSAGLSALDVLSVVIFIGILPFSEQLSDCVRMNCMWSEVQHSLWHHVMAVPDETVLFCQEKNRTEDIKVAWDFMLDTALQAEKKLIISICGNWGYSICCFPMSSILLTRLVGVWRSEFNDNRRSYNPVQLSVFDNHISIFHINNIQLSEWTHQLLSTNNRLSNECLSTMHPHYCRDVIGSPIGQTSKEGAGLI